MNTNSRKAFSLTSALWLYMECKNVDHYPISNIYGVQIPQTETRHLFILVNLLEN